MRRFSAALFALVSCAGPAWAEPQTTEILQTLDQAMIERSAAARCGAADSVKAAAFGDYYRAVSGDALVALKTLASDLDQSHIEKVMKQHYDEIDRRVSAIVAQESCDGTHIKEALQKYDDNANVVMAQQSAKKID